MDFRDLDTSLTVTEQNIVLNSNWLAYHRKKLLSLKDSNERSCYIKQHIGFTNNEAAIISFLKKSGLVDSNLIPSILALLIAEGKLSYKEFCLHQLIKQSMFLGDNPKYNFLTVLLKYIVSQGMEQEYNISTIRTLNLDLLPEGEDITTNTRNDYCLTLLEGTGLFKPVGKKDQGIIKLVDNASAVINHLHKKTFQNCIHPLNSNDRFNFFSQFDPNIITDISLDHPKEWVSFFPHFVEGSDFSIVDINTIDLAESHFSQTIFYGCPGSGKSFKVKRDTGGEYGEKIIWWDKEHKRVENPTNEQKKELTNNIFRTTFHPDYDYATFVGCYKPVKERNDKDKDDENSSKEEYLLDYKFVPQVFTNAYVAAHRHPKDPIYLIIEEINRGNCAQIFGDLFQLLDRTNGESDYEIKPDTELAKYLELQNVNSKILCLPSNLHIYATMNTSDQSLFPMDSAFKRRWAWEYVPIDYNQEKAKTFTIEIGNEKYPWIGFLQMANEMILNATDSEDKQMGEFFIRGDITEKEFINKVMFYLWNDVCKDLYNPRRISATYFFRIKTKLENEKDFFTFAELFGSRNINSMLLKEFLSYLEGQFIKNHLNDHSPLYEIENDKIIWKNSAANCFENDQDLNV